MSDAAFCGVEGPEPLRLPPAHYGVEDDPVASFTTCRSFSPLALTAAALVVLTSPVPSAAQTAAPPHRWDAGVATGLFLGHPSEFHEQNFDDWYNAAMFAISAGRYLTAHLKAEGEVVISGQGERYVTRRVPIAGLGNYPIYGEHRARTNTVAGTIAWQFFENQWVHPFVFTGVSLDFDRGRLYTPRQSQYRGDPRLPGSEVLIAEEGTEDLGTAKHVRGILGVGVKMYFTPQAFFRADSRIGVGGQGSGNVALRLGVGVDF
jgi:hypothetical protein